MINLSAVNNIYIIRPFLAAEQREKVDEFIKKLFIPRDPRGNLSVHTVLAEETVTNEDKNNPPFEEVSPLIRKMETEYNYDPTTLFVIDPSSRTTSALAKLLEGPYRGFPWSGQTIVLPKDS